MEVSYAATRRLSRLFWALAVSAVTIWSLLPGYVSGWDVQVYRNAMHSLRAGHDPYSDGIAVQEDFHARLASLPPDAPPPYTYVYSPMTLPALGAVAKLPGHWSARLYWLLYGLAIVAALWVGLRFVEPGEQRLFLLAAPAAVFFPGLLQNDVLFSGNVAYIGYGLAFLLAWRGWRRGQWLGFYAVVLLVSVCKAPMLTLLAIPVLSERRQWWPAVATGAVGVGLFAIQRPLWPVLFRHYMEAVDLQFRYNRDFSSSPAGLLSNAFFHVLPYAKSSVVFYLLYAVPVFGCLLWLSRRYQRGELSLKEWAPLVLVAAILLNPRVMEYDVAPITIPMALVAWRFVGAAYGGHRPVAQGVTMAVFFAVINAIAAVPFASVTWRPTEGTVLLLTVVGGIWTLWKKVQGVDSVAAVAVEEPGHIHA